MRLPVIALLAIVTVMSTGCGVTVSTNNGVTISTQNPAQVVQNAINRHEMQHPTLSKGSVVKITFSNFADQMGAVDGINGKFRDGQIYWSGDGNAVESCSQYPSEIAIPENNGTVLVCFAVP